MPLSRKHFVASAALGASAGALLPHQTLAAVEPGERAPLHFHILKAGEFDHALMMKTLTSSKAHKQVFQSSSPLLVAPGIASLYIHMQNSMNAHEFSLGFGRSSLATLGVLLGASVVFGLNDAMWKKYGFGETLKLAPANSYYKASSALNLAASPDDANGIYQDWSAQAVLHRGGAFMICHNAMTAVAALFAQKTGATPQAVLTDFEKNVLAGFQVVPAGVATVQLAQQHGWTYFAIV